MDTYFETTMCGNPVQVFLKSEHPKSIIVTVRDVTILLAADWLEMEIANNGCMNIPATQEMIRLREAAIIVRSEYIAKTVEEVVQRVMGDLRCLGVQVTEEMIAQSTTP